MIKNILIVGSGNIGSRHIQAIKKIKKYKTLLFVVDINKKNLRKDIMSHGAKFIIAYFDQGTTNDERFGFSHLRSSKIYEFLLTKTIENKNIGLLIKPKKPKLLYLKISHLNELVNKAIATGRIYIESEFDSNSTKNFRRPPSLFSIASDLTIHDTLVAGTAGVESYLSGTNTVFCDFYGFKNTIFNKNNDQIVFYNLESLWKAIYEKFILKNKKKLGFWDNNLKKQIDSFSDGKSNIRTSYIINHLQYNFNNNLEVSTNIENTLNQYSKFIGTN